MNIRPPARRAAVILTVLLSAAASAQTEPRSTRLYRCGPEGRELRDAPCPGARASSAQDVVYDQPSQTQQTASQRRVRSEQQLADDLARERQQREAQAVRSNGAAIIHSRGTPEPAAKPASAPQRTKKPKLHKPKAPKTASPSASSPG